MDEKFVIDIEMVKSLIPDDLYTPLTYEQGEYWDGWCKNEKEITLTHDQIYEIIKALIESHPNHSQFLFYLFDVLNKTPNLADKFPEIWQLSGTERHVALDTFFDGQYFGGTSSIPTSVFPRNISPLNNPNTYIEEMCLSNPVNFWDEWVVGYLLSNNSKRWIAELVKEKISRKNMRKLKKVSKNWGIA